MKYFIILDVSASAIGDLLMQILLLNVFSLVLTICAYQLCKKIKDKLLIKWVTVIIAGLIPVFVSHLLFSFPSEIVPFTIATGSIFSMAFIAIHIVLFLKKSISKSK